MTVKLKLDTRKMGPFFSGAMQRHLHLAVDEAAQEIVTLGANHLRGDLGEPPFENPTGWYKSHITPKRVGAMWEVQDSGVVYGPWLAGTSSRNKKSRFKGYKHWRRLFAYMDRIAGPVVEKMIAKAIGRMG
jgi:hypothetical protein